MSLNAVRTAIQPRPGRQDEMDWTKTWVAEMAMTRDEKDRRRGLTPEMKRVREVKAGIITASAGVGLTVVVAFIMEGIIASGVSAAAIAILSRLWIVGLIPVLVGAALIVNGMFVTKREKAGPSANELAADEAIGPGSEYVAPATTNQLESANFGVVEETTKHLETRR